MSKNKKPVLGYKNQASFYASKSWRSLRAWKLQENPFCERCLPRLVIATDVHHRIDVDRCPDLALAADNLESLCGDCHKKETTRRQHAAAKQGGIVTKYNLKPNKR